MTDIIQGVETLNTLRTTVHREHALAEQALDSRDHTAFMRHATAYHIAANEYDRLTGGSIRAKFAVA